jgi:raffinose/stachyose/melibiose transport system substrate-binding protein
MKKVLLIILAVVFVFSVAACGNNNNAAEPVKEAPKADVKKDEPVPAANESSIKGEITVLTQRTDIVDSVFKEKYLPIFNEKYPDIKVKFEAITDYEGAVKIRMNTDDYGDVLLIPNNLLPEDLPAYFEPLGSLSELSEKYLFAEERAYQDVTYGLPIVVNANGVLYNKQVFKDAGITDLPKSTDEFLAAMQKIKDNTDAIPFYTNYAAGWPLAGQWQGNVTSIAGDVDYYNNKMPKEDDIFAAGKPHHTLYKLMYDLAKQGLIEPDPTTTDWELSKPMFGEGKIGAMILGSWAITQFQDAAGANKDNVGYMPFPSNVNGKIYSSSGGDYKIAINVHSKNKAAARAYLDWFLEESGYADQNGGINVVKGKPMPSTLAAFDELGVELISNTPASAEMDGWVSKIDLLGEVGLEQPDFRQRIIEAAIGNRKESLDDIFADLNKKWNKAKKEITGM